MLLALAWSVLAWPVHALAVWIAANSAAPAGLPQWIENWGPPPWLAGWMPEATLTALKTALTTAAPLLEWILALVPGLAGWLPPLILVAWASGLALLLLAGIACSVAVRLLARRAPARQAER